MRTDERPATRQGLGWRRLLVWSAVAMTALFATAAGGFGDLEAAAFALAPIGCLVAMRVRRTLGLVGFAVMCPYVAFWMVPGAISNLSHHGQWVSVALPSGLSIAALAGLAAAVGEIVQHRTGRPPRNGPRLVGALAVVLVAASNIAGARGESDARHPGRAGDLSVTARHVRFAPARLEASATDVGVVVSNLDLFWHTFTIPELHVNLNVPVQSERRVSFRARPGTYEFKCSIPGHEQAGMKGTLVVR